MITERTSLQIQTVLYENRKDAIKTSFHSVLHSLRLAKKEGLFGDVIFSYGDSSAKPLFTDSEIAELQEIAGDALRVVYSFFNANLGTAKGHNTLANLTDVDFHMIMNPDLIYSPRTIHELTRPFNDPTVGLVEARQVPIEHPKDFDTHTGETSWASTACVLFPRSIYNNVDGFDEKTFFLYCDDVDFSWRVRLAGYKIIFQPSALVFHDKRLSENAGWLPTKSEIYYSAEASLLMAYKWSRPDLYETIIADFEKSSDPVHLSVLEALKQRISEGRMPQPIDKDHRIATFLDGQYAKHRYNPHC
jgi:hypothetical protein